MFEAFSVAIRLRLVDGVSAGLMGLSRHFARGNMEAKTLQERLSKIGRTMAIGTGLTVAGGGMLKLVESTLPAAREYANQLSLMNTLGMRQADVAKVVGQAWQTTFQVPTTSIVENLKSFRELRSAFGAGREQEAAAMLPTVGRIQGLLTALTGKEQDKVGFDLVKAIELRSGIMTEAQLQRNADQMAQTLTAFGGTLTVADYHGALKMGKMATQKWSDEFVYKYLPTFMQELKTAHGGGSQSAGTMLMSLYQAVNGRLTKASMPLWVQSGLVAQSDIVKNATGQFQMKPGAVKGYQEEAADPYLWVQTYLRPAIDRVTKARGITAEAAINSMFQNRNAAFAAYTFYNKAQQFERDRRTVEQAQGLGAYEQLLKTNPQLAEQALQKQWTNIKAQIGFTLMPDLLKAASALVPQLVKLSQWINRNPTAIGGWVKAFAVIGGLLTIAGSMTIVAGTISGVKLLFDILKAAKVGTGLMSLLSLVRVGSLIGRAAGLITAGIELVEVAFAGLAIVIGAPVEAIVGVGAAIAAAIAGIGIGLYQMWRHWDSSRTVFQNLKAELGMFVDWLKGIPGAIWNMLPGWARNMLGGGAPKTPATAAVPKPGQPPVAKPVTYRQANGRLDVRAVKDFWAPNGPAAHAAGKAVGQGVAQGVMAAHPAVRAAAAGSAGQAVAGFKQAADIHSPSRVFAALGDQLIAGLIMGVDRSAAGLMSRIADLAGRMAAPFRDSTTAFGSGPLGLRLNNPGNLRRWGDAARVHGFAAFHSAADGLHAMGRQLQLYAARGLNTVSSIVSRWAPSSENATGAYIAAVSRATGFGAHQRLNLDDTRQLSSLMGAMIRREQGRSPYSLEEIAKAVASPTRSPYVRQAAPMVEVHHRTMLDGRVLTETVTRHMAKDGRRPQASSNHFDPTMAPMWAGQRVAPS